MAEDTQVAPRVDYSAGPPPRDRTGRGWAVFAGVMFLCVAALNTLYGLAALIDGEFFSGNALLLGDIATWGAIALGFAVCQLVTGLLLLRQVAFGAFLGLMLAALHASTALVSIGAYPLWTTIAVVIDGLIIYGLAVHVGDWD